MTISPAGTSPAGIGAPTTSAALYETTRWQKSTTGAVSSVKIDPLTRDTVHDANGSEDGMSDTAQRVWLLLHTTLGSRANWLTQGFARPEALSESFTLQVETAVSAALAPVINDGSMSIVSVETEVDPTYPTRGYALVRWLDTRTQKTTTTRYPLQV